MLIEIRPNLHIGNLLACTKGPFYDAGEVLQETHATLHACKHPCHVRELKYSGKLPSDHPNYLVYEKERDLYLNIIDPAVPLFKPELFWAANNFIAKHIQNMPVIIHCVDGQSRAPSLALVYLAKHNLTGIDPLDYQGNDQWLLQQYPLYRPGKGIVQYLREHWETLLHGPETPQDA